MDAPDRTRKISIGFGAWPGADMCPAFDAANRMPRARMGLGPIHRRALRALVYDLVFPSPSLDRAPYLLQTFPLRRQPRDRVLGGRDRSSINSSVGQQRPCCPRHLVSESYPHQHRRLLREHAAQPTAGRRSVSHAPASNSACSDDQQTPYRSISHSRYPAKAILSTCRVLQRR